MPDEHIFLLMMNGSDTQGGMVMAIDAKFVELLAANRAASDEYCALDYPADEDYAALYVYEAAHFKAAAARIAFQARKNELNGKR
jgi:hypothetical protein